MSNEKILIIDYGVGNIYSISRALEKCGANNYSISGNADDVKKADKIILPGVGSFEEGMKGLKSRNLVNAIVEHGLANKPLLGICLGMQLLTTSSEEFGFNQGLGLIPGNVKKMSKISPKGELRKIPSIGWMELKYEVTNNDALTIFNGIPCDASFYFVHSYHVLTNSKIEIMAKYEFGGEEIVAAISHKKIFGVQFHPEKSGHNGLKIISNFIQI